MAQGLIVSKNENKKTLKTQEAFDNKVKQWRNFVNKVYSAISVSDGDKTLFDFLTDVGCIEVFIKDGFDGTGAVICRCPYILHGILADCDIHTFGGIHNFTNVLDKMPKSKIMQLKSLLIDAKKMKKPNVEEIKQGLTKFMGDVEDIDKLPKEKQLAAKSAKITLHAGKFWEHAMHGLDELTEAIAAVERKPHISTVIKDNAEDADCEKWSMKELCEKLGSANVEAVYTQKSRVTSVHAYVENWFVKDANKIYFIAKYFDEYKKLCSGNNSVEYDKLKHLTMEEMAELLDYGDNISAFYDQKQRVLGKNAKAKQWFVKERGSTRVLFIGEYFDEYERLSKKAYDKDKYITLSELANNFGCDVNALYRRKSKLLKKYPDNKDKIESWFVHRGKSQSLFDTEHMDEFKTLFFDGCRIGKTKKTDSVKQSKTVKSKTSKKRVEIPMKNEPKIEEVKTEVAESKGDDSIQQINTLFDLSQIKDGVDIKLVMAGLAGLQRAMQTAESEKTEAEAYCAKVMAKINAEKDAEKRVGVYHKASVANEAIANAAAKAKSLRAAIDKGNQLLENRQKAFDAFKESNDKVYDFYQEIGQYVK